MSQSFINEKVQDGILDTTPEAQDRDTFMAESDARLAAYAKKARITAAIEKALAEMRAV